MSELPRERDTALQDELDLDPPAPKEEAFEIVYHVDAKRAAKAYKRFFWRRVRRPIMISLAISLASLAGVFLFEDLWILFVLGTAYPAAYAVMWFVQLGQIDETYEALDGRKIRLLIDSGGISTYSRNTFKRVQWPGVNRLASVGDYYFIYYEGESIPNGAFPKDVLEEGALEMISRYTKVFG